MTRNQFPPPVLSRIMAHPLFAGGVSIGTPAVEDAYLRLKRVIALREMSCSFSGPSGAGKTYAIAMISAMLRRDFPRLCILSHNAGNQQLPSIRAFYKGFLNSVGSTELRGETWDLRARLVRTMLSEARQSSMNLVVLFIDEANAMTLQDFLFLKDVYNDLEREHVQLITVLMGQSPDLDRILDRLAAEGRLDIIGRFAMRRLQIRSYNSLADVQSVFKSIDNLMSGGESWTQFFLPLAYTKGFRLLSQSEFAFDAICRANPTGVSSNKVAFPARQFFSMIRSFLIDALSADEAEIDAGPARWDNAVEEARLQDAMALIKPQASKGKSR